jgi:hypothetical protein
LDQGEGGSGDGGEAEKNLGLTVEAGIARNNNLIVLAAWGRAVDFKDGGGCGVEGKGTEIKDPRTIEVAR